MALNLDSIPDHLRSDERSFFYRLKNETEIQNVGCAIVNANINFIEWARSKLAKIFEDSDETIGSERLFYRARVVCPPKTQLEPREMGAPPYWLATRGRVQPEGVSFLYTATEPQTAVAEVRPENGGKVAVGEFRIKDARTLKILKINQHPSSKDLLDEEDGVIKTTVLQRILTASRFSSNHFSAPVNSQKEDFYKETIFIAQIIQEMGYDGLSYKSALDSGGGVNYAFFSASHFVCERVHHQIV